MTEHESMTILLIVALVAIAILAALFLRRRLHKGGDEAEPDEDDDAPPQQERPGDGAKTINVKSKPLNMDNKYDGMNTTVLLRAILEDLNCKYDETERGDIAFMFQGENFLVVNSPDSMWIRIYDTQWYDCTLDKLEEISCMQKAINIANSTQSCTAIYSISKDDNKMIVYSKCDLLISCDFPAPDQYLAVWLTNFFRLKQQVIIEFEKEKQKIGLE